MSNVYTQLMENSSVKRVLENYNDEFENFSFRWIQERLRYPLRPYQKKASIILELMTQNSLFLQDVVEKVDHKVNIPMLTFEMATGAGKTLQMLAHILYLKSLYNYKDFLIITPNNIIYDKTVENFSPNHFESEWSLDQDLKVNIVTSENYKEKACWVHEEPDLNIYIFNVQKFYSKPKQKKSKGDGSDISSGIPWVFRALEDSVWKDENDNCLSFVDYLRSRGKLAILSDEAHHYQQNTSKKVITDLLPTMVLEYTATPQRGLQNVVYQYGIKNLIDEKYSKRIRTLSFGKYAGSLENKSQLINEDKKKIMLGLIVHQVKKTSVVHGEKALCLIKAREIEHARKIEEFLANINVEKVLFKEVINDIKYSDSSMSKIILELFDQDSEDLWNNIKKSCSALPLRYDSETNQNKEVRTELMRLETPGTLTEIIIAVDALDEGWNVKRLYTIVVLHEGEKEIATSVKQLIGRGIRLYRDKRIKDNRSIKEQQDELLHIICVAGRSFDRAISLIAKELGLSSDDIGSDEEYIELEQQLESKWKDQPIPLVVKRNVSIFSRTVNAFKTDEEAYIYLLNRFVEEHCSLQKIHSWLEEISIKQNGKYILGILPNGQLVEKELYTTNFIENEQRDLLKELSHTKLEAPSKEMMKKEVFEKISIIGQVEESHEIMYDALKLIFNNLYRVEGTTEWDVHKKLLRHLMLWLKEKLTIFWNYTDIKHEKTNLGVLFGKETLTVPKTRIVSDIRKWLENRKSEEEKKNIRNYYFNEQLNGMIYGKTFRADSTFELEMVLRLSEWFSSDDGTWIKNERQYSVPYKNEKGKWFNYYPDFIIFYKNHIYLLETKGDIYLEDAKPKKVAAEQLYEDGYPIKYLFVLYSKKDKLKVTNFSDFLFSLDQ